MKENTTSTCRGWRKKPHQHVEVNFIEATYDSYAMQQNTTQSFQLPKQNELGRCEALLCGRQTKNALWCRWWGDGQAIGSRYSTLHQVSLPAIVVVMPHESLMRIHLQSLMLIIWTGMLLRVQILQERKFVDLHYRMVTLTFTNHNIYRNTIL